MLTLAPQKFGDPATGIIFEIGSTELTLTRGADAVRYTFDETGERVKAEIRLGDQEWAERTAEVVDLP